MRRARVADIGGMQFEPRKGNGVMMSHVHYGQTDTVHVNVSIYIYTYMLTYVHVHVIPNSNILTVLGSVIMAQAVTYTRTSTA